MAILNLKGKGGDGYMEPGDYLAHIFKVEDNDKTAKPSINITFKNNEGDIVKRTFWLTEAAEMFIARLAISTGCADGPKDPQLDKFNTRDLQGRSVMIRVVKESRDGADYSVVKSFWKPKDALAQDKEVKNLMDTVKSAGHKLGTPQPGEQEPPEEMREPGQDEDELPF